MGVHLQPEPQAAPQPSGQGGAVEKPNVDYSKWRNLDDSDDVRTLVNGDGGRGVATCLRVEHAHG